MTEIDRLRALAAFASVLCSPMFDPGHWVAAKELGDGSIHIGYVSLAEHALKAAAPLWALKPPPFSSELRRTSSPAGQRFDGPRRRRLASGSF